MSEIAFPFGTAPRFITCGGYTTAIGVSGPYSESVGNAASSRYVGIHGRQWQCRQLMWSTEIPRLALFGQTDTLKKKTASMELWNFIYSQEVPFDTTAVDTPDADSHQAWLSFFAQRYGFDILEHAVARTLTTSPTTAPPAGFVSVNMRGNLSASHIQHTVYRVPYSVAAAIIDKEREFGAISNGGIVPLNLIFETSLDETLVKVSGYDPYDEAGVSASLPVSGASTTEPQTYGYLPSSPTFESITYASKATYPETAPVGSCVVTAHPFLVGIQHTGVETASMFLYEADYGALATALQWWGGTTGDQALQSSLQEIVTKLNENKGKALQLALVSAPETAPDIYDDPDIQDALASPFVERSDIDKIVVAGKRMDYWRATILAMGPRSTFACTGKARGGVPPGTLAINASYLGGVYTFTHQLTGRAISVPSSAVVLVNSLPTGDRDTHIMNIEAQTGAKCIDGQASFNPIKKAGLHIGQRSKEMRWLFHASSSASAELSKALIGFTSCLVTDTLTTQ